MQTNAIRAAGIARGARFLDLDIPTALDIAARADRIAIVRDNGLPVIGTHGHDDNPPEFGSKRGSEVRDPLTGEVIRQGEMSPQNIAVDRLEWMLKRKRIETYQHQAGRQLQADVELAQIATYATSGARTGGSGSSTLSDAKCDAIGRVNQVRIALRGLAWRILELVVIDGLSVEKAETRLRLRYRAGHGALLVALDSLAAHYGLC